MPEVVLPDTGQEIMSKIEKYFVKLATRQLVSTNEVIDFLFDLHTDAEKVHRAFQEYATILA